MLTEKDAPNHPRKKRFISKRCFSVVIPGGFEPPLPGFEARDADFDNGLKVSNLSNLEQWRKKDGVRLGVFFTEFVYLCRMKYPRGYPN